MLTGDVVSFPRIEWLTGPEPAGRGTIVQTFTVYLGLQTVRLLVYKGKVRRYIQVIAFFDDRK